MKILLVQIINPDRTQDAIIPTGLGYIAAYLRQEMDGVEIRIEQHNLEQVVKTFQPDLIGISSVTQNYERAKQFSAWCKTYDEKIPTVIGGHHISALPGSMSADMDLAVIGEGEITMLEICKTIQRSGMDFSALRKIDGIAYKDESGILHRADPRTLITDLDVLPFPARDLMRIVPGEAVGIMSSRGCPYHCTFCASRSFWGSVRFHSAEYVVREVKIVLEQLSPRHIYFWDDLFAAQRNRFKRIVSLLKESGIPDRVRFSLNCRANLVDRELIRFMNEMNVFEVSLGLESFSPDVLSYLKDHVTVEDNWRAIELFNQANIRVMGFFIIGSPHETREDILQTLDALKQADLHRAQAYILTPLPGTRVWDYAYQRGLVSEEMDWSRLYIDAPKDKHNGIVLSEVLEPAEIRDLLSLFQSARRRKELKILVTKVFYYVKQVLIEPRTVWALVKRSWRLQVYKIKDHVSRALANS